MTARADRLFATLDPFEVNVVARTVVAAQRMRLCGIARATTRLGNGWIYPLVSLLVLLGEIDRPVRALASSAASLALGFAIYPAFKRLLARARPCDYAPWLAKHPQPMDRYSCPSGHAMTATAYAIPLVLAWPAVAPVAIGIWALIGWSRIAVGHHYLSDVLFGTLLGALVATPVVLLVF
jgi:undecaprenyl-diphosphatase